MEAREIILIPASGTPGSHGSGPGDYPHRPYEAPAISNGKHGQSATTPTPGTNAQDLVVTLSYLDAEPELVQVAGTGIWTGKVWKVARDQELHLDCKGGDGGNGGKGEDGQQGGRGGRGRDATKHRDAEPGGMGGKGGDGGYGSNGADGGNGGSVFITVNEDDLDLLIACTWDTSGGKGGASGTHGMPGDGGIGGDGGNGCTWTERSGNSTYHYSRPDGPAGSQGPPGAQPSTYLSGGRSGREGATHIRVLKKDLTEATYPGRYDLEVVSFDVVDENGDGINEPGEHILVRNIKVRNKGVMPSPGTANPISVLIHGTHWLEPVQSEPVAVPDSILPGETVDVPGTLRAYIRNETSLRQPGEPLNAKDDISLIAVFHQRLNRTLPRFSGTTKYDIRYPIELTPPKCLDCVQKGDRVRFSWILRNVSRKAYGIQGLLSRYTATRFSDPIRVFDLPYSDKENERPHEAVDALDEIQPGDEVPIEQDFIVSMTSMEYSDAQLHLELLLADPFKKTEDGNAVIRSVMKYNINMQIAGVYKHDHNSRYLLVVNSKTPNWAIHQIISFVRHELRLGLDIFNISVSGSYTDNATAQSVLQNYQGKSIIIYGNSFNYFGRGARNPWNLLDTWEVGSLAKGGTNFLFYGVENQVDLTKWVASLTYSEQFDPSYSKSSGLLKELIHNLQGENQARFNSDIVQRQFTAKQNILEQLFSCFQDPSPDKMAFKSSKKLSTTMPLRRFLAVPNQSITDPKMPNIFVIEGLPTGANVSSSTATPAYNPNFTMQDYFKYAILNTLPFNGLARVYWNAWGTSQPDANGAIWFPASLLYNGTGWHEAHGIHWQGAMLHSKIINFVCLAIETRIGTELAQFLSGSTPSKDMVNQLPLLNQFLGTPQGSGQLNELREQSLVLPTLGSILGSLLNIGFVEWISHKTAIARKYKLRKQTHLKINDSLSHMCTASLLPTLQNSIATEAERTKEKIKNSGDSHDLSRVNFKRMVEMTQTNIALVDLASRNPGSKSLTVSGLNALHQTREQNNIARSDEEKHAAEVLATFVNPEVEDE